MFLFGLWTIFHIWHETSRYCIGIRWTRWHRLQGILVSYASMLQGLSMIDAHLNISDVCPSHMPVEKMDIWQRDNSELHLSQTITGSDPTATRQRRSFCCFKAGNRELHGNRGHLLRWREDQWRGSWNDDCRSCHTQPGCTVCTFIKVLKTEALGRFRLFACFAMIWVAHL